MYAYTLWGRIALWSHQSAQTANSEQCIVQIVNVPQRGLPTQSNRVLKPINSFYLYQSFLKYSKTVKLYPHTLQSARFNFHYHSTSFLTDQKLEYIWLLTYKYNGYKWNVCVTIFIRTWEKRGKINCELLREIGKLTFIGAFQFTESRNKHRHTLADSRNAIYLVHCINR